MNVGVLGGGQLGRMLALSAHRLGVETVLLDPDPAACAGQVSTLRVAAYDNGAALDALAAECDVVTWEFENVPAAAVERLEGQVQVWPPRAALAVSQDRLAEKQLFAELGIGTAEYHEVNDVAQLRSAIAAIGGPAVLKSRRGGYDGKGQVSVDAATVAEIAWKELGQVPAILERRVPFVRELSILAVRSTRTRIAFYPLTQNEHAGGILRTSTAPAHGVFYELEELAQRHARRVLERLGYVGVLAIELFETADGQLLANELAPRVHNSGHWTMDGAATGQFENHLRAVAGLPVGATGCIGEAGMVNLIGELPPLDALLRIEGARVHLYGKQPRPGRKLGHVNAVDSLAALSAVRALVGSP